MSFKNKKRRNKPCKNCGGDTIRIDKYDAYACRACVIWNEKGCSDPECEFCANRPPTPINVDWEDKWNT